MKAESSRGGFTLLEVLAAVAILGVVFSMLVASSMQSLRKQGENFRSVQAGLIADRYLSDLETNMMSGVLPEPGESEEVEERDGVEFTVLVRVLPFEAYAEDQPPAEFEAGVAPDPDAAANLFELVAKDAADLQEMMSTVRVEVLWKEGVDEHEVVRTTYALDVQGTLAAFPYERAVGGGGDGGDADSDEESDEGDGGSFGPEDGDEP